ncbi:MAG: SDR family oxidoreductase [Candidatus Cyclobacteriaceae bacterium M2_1C_046]
MKILVTGGAGFIGSNLVEYLLNKEEVELVRVLDNLSTGHLQNLKDFDSNSRFEFIEGDIRDLDTCNNACEGMDYVLHQAALGSVPRSIKDPITSNEVNIGGFLNMLVAARDNKVKRLVYAASSSTYGDSIGLPKVEDKIGKPLSPYAITKYVNELYADVFYKTYGLETIGLRYFNVFGPRQDPNGAYAAVIPKFIDHVLKDEAPTINGDGTISRDFTYVDNVVQANFNSLTTDNKEAVNQVYNVACGDSTTLTELFTYIKEAAGKDIQPNYGPPRQGDILHSLADVSKAKELISYEPKVEIREGLEKTYNWFKENSRS